MINIRHATTKDATLLTEIGIETFSEAFAKDNKPEYMASYLAGAFSLDIQTAELAEPGSIFLIAEIKDETVGYAHLKAGSTVSSVIADSPVELVRIYARPPWIGQGVGAVLIKACLAEAKRLGGDVIWLGVWERNPRAIRFYQKWGFVQVGTHDFQLGDELQTDWVMERSLEDLQ